MRGLRLSLYPTANMNPALKKFTYSYLVSFSYIYPNQPDLIHPGAGHHYVTLSRPLLADDMDDVMEDIEASIREKYQREDPISIIFTSIFAFPI